MAQKKARKTQKTEAAKKSEKKPKASKNKPEKKPKASKNKPEKKPKASKKKPKLAPEQDAPVAASQRPTLTDEDAMAMAEALVEMFNEGADNPVAFFVSGDDALGRELIQLQGGDVEDLEGVVPVVLDAAQVRRYAMLTIADEMIWRQRQNGEG